MKILYIALIFAVLLSPLASAQIVGNFTNPVPLKTVSLAEAKVNETETKTSDLTNVDKKESGSWVDQKINETTTVLTVSVTEAVSLAEAKVNETETKTSDLTNVDKKESGSWVDQKINETTTVLTVSVTE